MEHEKEYILDNLSFEELCFNAQRGCISKIRVLFDNLRHRTGKKVPGKLTLCPPPSFERRSPLILAALHGRLEVLEFFALEYGDSVDLNCTCAVNYALQTRRPSFGVVAYSPCKMRTSVTPLIAAAMGGHGEITEYLLQQGVSVDAADCCGWTALHHAVAARSVHCCRVLASYGADINYVDCHGHSPLCLRVMLGALAEESAILHCLLEHQAYPIGRERNPVYLAAMNEDKSQSELNSYMLPQNVFASYWWLLGASARFRNRTGSPELTSTYEYWSMALLEGPAACCKLPPPKAYGSRTSLQSLSGLDRLRKLPILQQEVESLYQSLIICEWILGYKFCYEILSTASEMMFTRGFGSKGQLLLIRALDMHHEYEQWITERHGGWQHNMYYCLLLVTKCRDKAKVLHQSGIPPLWACYVQYGIKQIMLAHPLHFTSHIEEQLGLDVLRICHVIFDIFSLWLMYSGGEKSEWFTKQLTEFIHILDSTQFLGGGSLFVLLQETNSPHTKWRTPERLAEMLQVLLMELKVCRCVNARNADGDTLLHLAAKLKNEKSSLVALSALLDCDAHIDILSYNLKTPREMYYDTHGHYPEEVSGVQLTEFTDVPALGCLAARAAVKGGLPYELLPFLPPTTKRFLRLHGPY